ncbi:MAG: class I SAM-dependent methyltransferase [Alphaproteobacteria bacterium]|nr:class I SAM-dependent methyltransferase [Alphaproteobacteria bacterium]
MSTAIKNENWWADFYDDVFADVMLEHEVHDPEYEQTISFLEKELKVKLGDTIFDQCCGVGAVSMGLARKGKNLIGVDQCDSYIQRAKGNAEKEAVQAEFYTGDAFEFKPNRICDAAFNWYTSFGYSQSDEQNKEMLKRSYEAIKEGGMFALDFSNIIDGFMKSNPCKVIRRETPNGEVTLLHEYGMNVETGMYKQTWTFFSADGSKKVHHGGAKMYLPSRIRELLEEVGFINIKMFGGVKGQRLCTDSPRAIFICEKPKGA